MLVSLWGLRADSVFPQEEAPVAKPGAAVRARRAVTAMEYLVMISFVLVVVILTVQHLGGIAGGLFNKSAAATKFDSGNSDDAGTPAGSGSPGGSGSVSLPPPSEPEEPPASSGKGSSASKKKGKSNSKGKKK